MVVKENQEYTSVKYFIDKCIGQAANKLKCRLINPGSRLDRVNVLGFQVWPFTLKAPL